MLAAAVVVVATAARTDGIGIKNEDIFSTIDSSLEARRFQVKKSFDFRFVVPHTTFRELDDFSSIRSEKHTPYDVV